MDNIQEDKILSDFLTSLGVWRDAVVIGGGYALIIYKIYLASKKSNINPVGTRDIDSLVPRKIPKKSAYSISQHLEMNGFSRVFKDRNHPATESYLKELNGIEIEVEFLTDRRARRDKDENISISGVVAQPLRYIEMSLDSPYEFYTIDGTKGWVVSPAAWVFHKGLTFEKRKSRSKSQKDLYGIWYALSQLAELSELALEEFYALKQKHPSWFAKMKQSLNRWMHEASPVDWEQLELQDPSGALTRLRFVRVLRKVLD